MLWWIALGIVIIGPTTYFIRHRRGRSTPLDQAQVGSARWTNEGKGFGAEGSF
jgi:hypothetical protein